MKSIDNGVVKEILIGSVVAAVCFGAPSLVKYMFPEPTEMHEIAGHLPYLGCLVIGLTGIRLSQRKKNLQKNV